ncbi:DUF1838 family protein [Paucibacter sp. JuS9]|uniref:DUF1838 family protein n=1 Tax=Paucibacter sp. JuS9 TaxID=3228748 RepID=UPI00375819DF
MIKRLSLLVAAWFAASSALALDVSSPEGGLQALIKMRASLDGREVIADWKVTAFAVVPGQRMRPLFRLDGFNAARMEKQGDGGWRMISREVAYYRDLKTGEVLQRFANPLTGQTDDVLQVVNDPVNVAFPAPTPTGRRVTLEASGDQLVLRQDVPLLYANPVSPKEYPLESTGENYIASEHFTYFARAADVLDDKQVSVPTHYGWTRVGPWLPWMRMGAHAGHILYVGHGAKLSGPEQLDPVVRAYTEKHHPEFMKAPAAWSQPNETSWTYFRKQHPPQAASSPK